MKEIDKFAFLSVFVFPLFEENGNEASSSAQKDVDEGGHRHHQGKFDQQSTRTWARTRTRTLEQTHLLTQHHIHGHK